MQELEESDVIVMVQTKEKKSISIKPKRIILGFSLYVLLTFIHELGHLIFLLLFGARIYGLIFNYEIIGFDASLYHLEIYQQAIIHIAGILISIFVSSLLIRYSKKAQNSWIYYSSWLFLLSQVLYLPLSIMISRGDFYAFITILSLSVYSYHLFIFSSILFLISCILFFKSIYHYEGKNQTKN
ncbi:MAG: hypothetical protein ACFFCI_00945 [Promethearchaeota archaeon]